MAEFDFSGWASRNNLKCGDGRTIRRDAFKDQDGQTVPLVWQHMHDDPDNVLGHATLENRPDGVYAYCKFNNTPKAQNCKELVKNGDVNALSIWANNLKHANGRDVVHGIIREVSLVLSGSNPGALIDNLSLAHSDGTYSEVLDEAIIFNGMEELYHDGTNEGSGNKPAGGKEMGSEKTVADVVETMDDAQKECMELLATIAAADAAGEEIDLTDEERASLKAVYESMNKEQQTVTNALVGAVIEGDDGDAEHDGFYYEDDDDYLEYSGLGGDTYMKQNLFEGTGTDENLYLSHSALEDALSTAKAGSGASLRDTLDDMLKGDLKHAGTAGVNYGITDIDILFPDAHDVTVEPYMLNRDTTWVGKVLNGVHHSPFARVRSTVANITADEARAKGYIKGEEKKEEVFKLAQRETTPQTIYKKQKLDRDDIIDITSFNIVAYVKREMKVKYNEELARAILVGDGRQPEDHEHIKEDKVRPIYKEDDTLYSIHKEVAFTKETTDKDKFDAYLRAVKKSKKDYRGRGNVSMYINSDLITDWELLMDNDGRYIFDNREQIARKFGVKEIVEVPYIETTKRNATPKAGGSKTDIFLDFILVNLSDYTVGSDRGGETHFFEDFDIDFNQEKYLLECRLCGALVVPFSAIIVEHYVPAAA